MRIKPPREHVEAIMDKWRRQMGVKRRQVTTVTRPPLKPVELKPTHGATDDTGITAEMRALMERRPREDA